MPNFLFHETSPHLFISSLVCVCSKFLQLCLTLCDLMDCSLPGSSVHGISQARILEWIAISDPAGDLPTQGSNLSLLHLLHWQAGSLPLVPLGKPRFHECPLIFFRRCLIIQKLPPLHQVVTVERIESH